MGDLNLLPDIGQYQFWQELWQLLFEMVTGVAPLLFVGRMIKIKPGIITRGCLYVTGFLIMWLPCFIGDFLNFLLAFLGFTAAVCVGCEGSAVRKISAAVLTAGISFSVSALTDNFFIVFNGYTGEREPAYWAIRLGYWGAMCLLAFRVQPKGGYDLPKKLYMLFVFLSVPVFGILGGCMVLPELEMAIRSRLYFGIFLFCMLHWVGMILMMSVLERQQVLEKSEHFYQMRQQYYNAMEQQQREVRRLRHDMKNHLSVLAGLEGEAQKAYLQEILNAPAFRTGVHFCENRTVNVVLCSKAEQAKENGVEFKVDAAIPEDIPVDPMDLCALMGNILDNALEAVLKIPEEDRKISFRAGVEKGLFAVEVKNPYLFLEMGVNGQPATLKKDRKNHGYGIDSAKEVVERYGGEIQYSAQNGEFTLFFYLPV